MGGKFFGYNTLVMLGKQFNKVIKRMDKNPRSNVKNISFDILKSNEFGRKRAEEKSTQGKGIQCHGCEGFGHIRAKCPTYLKKQKKNLSVTWSEEDSDLEEEHAKYVKALTGKYVSDEDSSDGELNFDELAASYKELCLGSA